MRAGLPISVALHVGLFFGGMVAFDSAKPMEEGVVVPVELITVDELTDIRASLKRPEKAPEPEPEPEEEPAPMTVETSIQNAPVEADVLKIAPSEESTAVTPPPAPEETVPTEEAEPQPEPKPEPEKPSFDLDRISTLIDKSEDTAPVADSQVAQEAEKKRLVYADRAREGFGTGTKMTMSEKAAFQRKMRECWRMPADVTEADKLAVRLQIDLLPGGYVKDVRVIDRAVSRRNAPGNPFWDVVEMRAVQAVSKCAPYSFLPPQKFEEWQSTILNFRPQL